jgi:hypothetical protein
MVSNGLIWSLMVPLWSLMVSYSPFMVSCGLLWSRMVSYALFSVNKYNTFIGLLYYCVCQLLHMQNHRHDSKTQCTTRTSLWPLPGSYSRVSWAVPGLALAATAAGISQDDTAALQYSILTDKEQ